MSLAILDLKELYENIFRKPYQVKGFNEQYGQSTLLTPSGRKIKEEYKGKDIWMPTRFTGLDKSKFPTGELFFPYVTVSIANQKTMIKTPLVERTGTVKELYSMDDYAITMKGFLLDETYNEFPEAEIVAFRKLYELSEAVEMDNASINIFLDANPKVVIDDFQFMEVKDGRQKYQPFTMRMFSDSVFTLEVE